MKDFKFDQDERSKLRTMLPTKVVYPGDIIHKDELIDRIETLIQSRADAVKPTPSIPTHDGNSVAGADTAFTDKVVFDLKICQSKLADKDREIMHLNDVINSARAEVERLKESNDAAINEREVMMQAFKDIREAFESREWITQGRGSYKYNDDRYMEEAKYLFADFKKIESETWRQIKSKGYEYKKSIEAPLLSELAESKRRIAELEDTWTGKENGLPKPK